jgi:hypothetical protein
MLDELEKAVQKDLDTDFPGVEKLRANFKGGIVPPSKVATVADQLLGVAETIKGINKDIDNLQREMIDRLNELRQRLGGRS